MEKMIQKNFYEANLRKDPEHPNQKDFLKNLFLKESYERFIVAKSKSTLKFRNCWKSLVKTQNRSSQKS